ncbi:MAG: hypothetical protein E5W30_01485, partial [Mesorhizobium sp.]
MGVNQSSFRCYDFKSNFTEPAPWLEHCRLFAPACFAYGVTMRIVRAIPLVMTAVLLGVPTAGAGEGSWISGDWY